MSDIKKLTAVEILEDLEDKVEDALATMSAPLTMSVSVQQKVNFPGRYESADVFMSVSGLTSAMTPDEIAALVDGTGKIAYNKLVKSLTEKVNSLRANSGYVEEDDE